MKTLQQSDFIGAASLLHVPVAVIKAVAEVESNGAGFLPDGKPVILFEPHVYWKELKKRNINPLNHVKGNEDILYPVWGSKPYGGVSKQHARMERAAKINRDAALSSASWGRFQIMGFNWKLCGFKSLQAFINAMFKSEGEHLNAFCNYILNTGLQDELIYKDWKGFARSYNGPLYWKNNYDKKLASAYKALA
jgi:hypothetical protein